MLRQLTNSEDFGTPVDDNINIHHTEKMKRVLNAMLTLYTTSCDKAWQTYGHCACVSYLLVVCGNTEEERKLLNAKCSHVNEVTACKKLINCPENVELRDAGNFVEDKTQMRKGNEKK